MIFIWIPKTGGTSFCEHKNIKIFTEYNEYNKDAAAVLLDGIGNKVTFGHASPISLLESGFITKRQWELHSIFTIVRDPTDRFVSLYHDNIKAGRIPATMSQREFAHAIYEMNPRPGLYNSAHLSMCAPQVCWILPGIKIFRLEDMSPNMPHLNQLLKTHVIATDAIPLISKIYAADYITLKYPMPK